MSNTFIPCLFLLLTVAGFSACSKDKPPAVHPDVDRESKIPSDVIKRGPHNDLYPPILHSDEFEEPVPLPYPYNTAGAEDSPFILPDGNTLYFWFTPDVRVPYDKQLLDDVTGIWVSRRSGETWSKPERVWLQEPGKLALDGAVCIQGEEMWFASAREGYTGVNMFTAELVNGEWKNWKYCGDRLMKEIQIGEVHIHHDTLYFHSKRFGGKGEYDIWMTIRNNGLWSDPVNIEAVNSETDDAFPFITADGSELWFTRAYLGTGAIFRSKKMNGAWQEPELIISQFAAEPTLDNAGNLYFSHAFYENNQMIEMDTYVARKKAGN